MNEPTPTNRRPLSELEWMVLCAWILVTVTAVLNRLAAGAPAATDIPFVVLVAGDIAITAALVYLAVRPPTLFWQRFSWVTIAASAALSAINLPGTITGADPGALVTETFWLALPALIWVNRVQLGDIIDRVVNLVRSSD